jgi:hypothetical protein
MTDPAAPTPPPLVALTAGDGLADRPDDTWDAFIDAMRALRAQLWLPPPYRFIHPDRTRTERLLADRLSVQGRTVTTEPYDNPHGNDWRDPDTDQLDRLARQGYAGLIGLLDDPAGDSHVLRAAAISHSYHRARVELRHLNPAGRQPAWTAYTHPDQLHHHDHGSAPDPPRRRLLGERANSAAQPPPPPWRDS